MMYGVEPQGFVAVTMDNCNCERCKKIITFALPLSYLPECSECNKKYGYILVCNIDGMQLCQRCYLNIAGLEKSMEIGEKYKWMHPKEHELWSIPADDIGYVIKDDDGRDRWLPMTKAPPKVLHDMNFTYRPTDLMDGETARQRIQNAKMFVNPEAQQVACGTLEETIDWEVGAQRSPSGIKAGMEALFGDKHKHKTSIKDKLKGLFK